MRYWGLTDKGSVRAANQDSFYAGKVDGMSGETVLCVVCDGMGGAKAGDFASATALASFRKTAEKCLLSGESPEKAIKKAAAEANRAVKEKADENPDYYGMGTTLVAAIASEKEAVVANVGDSRCYIIRNETISQITKDHSLVETMVDSGELSREQAQRHPRKNYITRAVGTENSVECDVFHKKLKRGDRLLLCSDGLSNIVNQHEMLYEICFGDRIETAAYRMLDIALGREAPDNVTVVLLEV